jgi:hypothetical protein
VYMYRLPTFVVHVERCKIRYIIEKIEYQTIIFAKLNGLNFVGFETIHVSLLQVSWSCKFSCKQCNIVKHKHRIVYKTVSYLILFIYFLLQ